MYFPRLYELREDHDLTQKKIAEYLTMHPEVYRRYEAGIREIPVWAVIRLAELYHVSTDYLLGLTDEKRTAMRKAALLCGTLSLAIFVSFISCRRAFCSRRRASARFFPRFRCCFRAERGRARAHLALLGAAIGLCLFSCRSIFSPRPRTRSPGKSV